MSEEEILAEIEKCKDPVYFYENYWTIYGKNPPLTDQEKELLREQVKLMDIKKRDKI